MSSIRNSGFVLGQVIGLFAIVILGVAVTTSHAVTVNWDNDLVDGDDTNFNNAANWSGGSGVPGTADNATFSGASAVNPNLTGAVTIQGVTFNVGASGYTLASSGPSLTLTNTGTTTNSAINAANTSGTNTISANLILNGAGATLTQAAGGSLVVSGNISNTTGLSLATGVGSIYTLSGNNSYTGTTTLNAGTLNIGSNTALGTGALVINNAGAILDATGGNRVLTNTATLSNSFAFTGTNNLTLGAIPAYAGDRTIALNSTTGKTLTFGTLTNSSNASRSLTVNGVGNKLILGGLQLASNTATAARVFTIDGSGTVEITGPVTNGTAGFNHEMRSFGSGTLILSGASTYTGTTRAISGTMQLTGSLNPATYLRIGQSGGASGKFVLGGTSNAVNQTVSRLDVPQVNSVTNPHNNTLVGGNAVVSIITVNSTTTDTFDAMIGGTGTNENNIGITKAGSGVLTLSNTAATGGPYNSYNGPTTVQAGGLVIQGQQTGTGATSITGGTLTISGTGSINGTSGVTINGSGAKLLYTSSTAMTGSVPITLTDGTIDGTGSIGATTVADNVANTIINGNGGNTTLGFGSLAFNGDATATLKVTNSSVAFAVANGLSTNGAGGTVNLTINHTGSVSSGFLNLISYGSYSGSLSDFTVDNADVADDLNARQSIGGLALNGNNIALQIIGDNARWTGLDNNNWATGLNGTNKNWHLVSANTPTDYIEKDEVLFDDSGINTAIDLGTNISPGNMTFNNSTGTPYSISSTGGNSISGNGTLTKSGTGTVTINTAATYTGGTVFTGGSLILGNASSGLGNGTVTIDTGSAKTIDNTSGGPINLGTTTQTWNDDFTFTGSNDLNMGTGAVALSGATRTVTVNGSRLSVGGLNGGTTTSLVVNGAGILAIGNSSVAGLSGTGILDSNSAANTLTINQATDGTVGGVVLQGGLSLTKNGAGKLTLANTNSYTGTTTLNVGTLVAANTAALGTSRLNILGNGTTFVFAIDADTDTPIPLGIGSNVTATIVSDRATPGAAVNRTMTVNTGQGLGGGTFNFTQGDNVTSGTGRITFNQLLLGAGGAGTTTLNPTEVNLSVGNISKTNNTAAQTIALDGTTTANDVGGIISNGAGTISLVKSNTSTWTLSNDNTYTGTTTISGGTLVLGDGGGSGTLGTGAVTNNGTLSYNRSDTALVDAHVISGTGSVRQIGSGKTTLSAVNTYSGPTVITAGTLAVTGSINNSAVSVTTGGILDGTGSVGATTVADQSTNTIANGNGGSGTLTLNSLTFSGDAAVNATKAGAAIPLAVTNALTTTAANGQVTINGSGTWTIGLNNLISFGSFGGSISDFSLGSVAGLSTRQTAGTLALNGNNIALNIVGDIVKWTGKDNGNWAVGLNGTLKNWQLSSGPATDYLDADEVRFDDSATGTTAIDLGSDVSPGSVTFNNDTKNYTLSSASGFQILTGTLTKSGTGQLTINNANSYNLGTIFNGGTLNLGNAAATLGSGPITIGAGSAKVLNNTSGGAITLAANSAQAWNDDFTFTGSNDLDMGTGAVTISGSSRAVTVNGSRLSVGGVNGGTTASLAVNGAGTLAIADSTVAGLGGNGNIANRASAAATLTVGSTSNSTYSGALSDGTSNTLGLTKVGTGTLTLAGASTYTGQTQIAAGTVVMAHGQAFGATPIIRFSATDTALDIATDGVGDTVYKTFMNSNININIISNRATPGPGIDHALTTSPDTTLDGFGGAGAGGNGIVTFTSGSNVTSGVGSISFDRFNLGAGGVATTYLNPTTARVTIGTVTKNKNAGAQTLDLGGTSAGNQVTGAISDGTAAVSLSKSGSNAWTISGNSTYTGGTSVNSGTLLVNGNNSGATGPVSIASSGTLGGTGTIGGSVTNNGTIAPGASVGTLFVNANVVDGANSHWAIELSGTSADMLAVTGSIDLTAFDSLDITGSGSGSSWIIGTYTGSLTGAFDNVTPGYSVTYTGGNITLNAAAGLPGDYNSDSKVDASDYVMWRKNNNTNNALPNDGGLGTPIGSGHYNLWRGNFGNPPGSGSSIGAGNVPEPAGLLLVSMAAVCLLLVARRRGKLVREPVRNTPSR